MSSSLDSSLELCISWGRVQDKPTSDCLYSENELKILSNPLCIMMWTISHLVCKLNLLQNIINWSCLLYNNPYLILCHFISLSTVKNMPYSHCFERVCWMCSSNQKSQSQSSILLIECPPRHPQWCPSLKLVFYTNCLSSVLNSKTEIEEYCITRKTLTAATPLQPPNHTMLLLHTSVLKISELYHTTKFTTLSLLTRILHVYCSPKIRGSTSRI